MPHRETIYLHERIEHPDAGPLAKLGYQPSGIIHNLDPDDPELVVFKQLR